MLEDAPEEQIGAHVGAAREDAVTASHLFEAQVPGYRGWRWSVTIALAGDDEPVTVSEVVLVPGPEARIAPAWVPWERRVRAGDLGVGDIFPTDDNDPRLAPAYLQSDDPAVEEVAHDAGLGRIHVLSRFGRTDAAARWHGGEFGPRSDMARSAPDVCGTCGFFVPLAGSLRGVFGVCSNDIAPADGHVVDVEYGCGAHSEVEVEVTSSVPVAELVYDDSLLDFTPAPEVVETAAAEPETAIAEADVSPAEVEPEAALVSASGAVAEPVVAEAATTDVVAEPVAAESAEVSSPPEAAEAEQNPATVVEPVEAESAQADATVADVESQVAEVAATEPVTTEVSEPAEAEPAQAEVTDAVAEPQATDAIAEPVAAEEVAQAESAGAEQAQAEVTDVASEPVATEVPEPAEAEPTQAEVTDAVAELQAAPESLDVATQAPGTPAESDAAEVNPAALAEVGRLSAAEVAEPLQTQPDVAAEPPAAESDAAEVDPVSVETSGEAEPAHAGVTDVVGERLVEVTEQEVEVPEAALTDNVVTEAGEPVAGEVPDAFQADAAATAEPVAPEAAEVEPATVETEATQAEVAEVEPAKAEAAETEAESAKADATHTETGEAHTQVDTDAEASGDHRNG
ncbi:DUF3027 domain-containing protein [Amycolatopsis sp. NPDC051758]|uniref:DUF3027 domain-containing protein n=1 Tax=Amycolatopsis sp. NPDC051758 TaxID=3363935 RepID=UPI0037B042A8